MPEEIASNARRGARGVIPPLAVVALRAPTVLRPSEGDAFVGGVGPVQVQYEEMARGIWAQSKYSLRK